MTLGESFIFLSIKQGWLFLSLPQWFLTRHSSCRVHVETLQGIFLTTTGGNLHLGPEETQGYQLPCSARSSCTGWRMFQQKHPETPSWETLTRPLMRLTRESPLKEMTHAQQVKGSVLLFYLVDKCFLFSKVILGYDIHILLICLLIYIYYIPF